MIAAPSAISKSGYFWRVKHGMTPEEARSLPIHRRPLPGHVFDYPNGQQLTLLCVFRKRKGVYHGQFRCKCGEVFIALLNNVKRGGTTSCGCYVQRLVQERRQKADLELNSTSDAKIAP